MILQISLLRCALAHQTLSQIQEILPKSNKSCSLGSNDIFFRYFSSFIQHFFKIRICPFIIPSVIYCQIDLVIYFPTPSIVIHRTQIQIPTVCHVDFRVQQSLFCFVNVHPLINKSLKQKRVKNILENRLIPLP